MFMWLLTYLFQNVTIAIDKFTLNLKGAINKDLNIMHIVKPGHFYYLHYIQIRSIIIADTSMPKYLQTNNSQYRRGKLYQYRAWLILCD